MSITGAEVINIENLLEKKLTIPFYQRPYKWTDKNVNRLLDDVVKNLEKKTYRLGTAIIHKDKNGELNIVDGQQRITTISLILKILEEKELLLESNQVENSISQENIRKNEDAIKSFIDQLNNKESFKEFLLEKCELIYIEIDDIDEAFQFFDSQNSRGKSLQGYDLLKAFHIREMREDEEEEMTKLVKQWEESSKNGSLDIIFNDLFAIRKYARGEKAAKVNFTRDDIDEFKGLNLFKHKYPYLQSYIINDIFINQDNTFKKYVEHFKGVTFHYPLQITEYIFNGKRFFEYIQYYIDLKVRLEKEEALNLNRKKEDTQWKLLDFFQLSNDKKVQFIRPLFQRILLFYYDKFGNTDLEKATLHFFIWAYTLRQQYKVTFSSLENYVVNNNFFKIIKMSLYHNQLISLKEKSQLKKRFYDNIREYEAEYPNKSLREGCDEIKVLIGENNER